MQTHFTVVLSKTVFFAALSTPLAWLVWQIAIEIETPTTALGADPGEAIVHFLGVWALRFLLLAFAISPIQKLMQQPVVGRLRRMAGLYAFAYALLHLGAYLFFFLEFEWEALLEDFVKRTFITVGLVALICLTPLAVTSTLGWQRRLRRNWKRVHLLVYPAIAFALIHLYWLTRDGFAEVVLYSIFFLFLVGFRWVKR